MSATKPLAITAGTYKIGAVARLTGLSLDTLRAWERRYQVVIPVRTASGNRLYTREDVERLRLIKHLARGGTPIGELAGLDLATLRECGAADRSSELEGRARASGIVIVGGTLSALIEGRKTAFPGVDILATYPRVQDLLNAPPPAQPPDVLVLEMTTVHSDSIYEINALLTEYGARQAVVVYTFAPRDAVRCLNTDRTCALPGPVNLEQLRRIIAGLGGAAPGARAGADPAAEQVRAARSYSDADLALIMTLEPKIGCECPHHLARLIHNLNAFETYSAQCEIRGPDDAALHAYLGRTTGRARAYLERALTRVLLAEGQSGLVPARTRS